MTQLEEWVGCESGGGIGREEDGMVLRGCQEI